MSIMSDAAPTEFRLLLGCLAWPRDQRRLEAIRIAALRDIDWDMLLRLAERHRVTALMQNALEAANAATPAHVEQDLRTRARATAQRELLCASETLRLHHAIAAAGQSAIALKGVALAMTAYGRLGLRYNHDIDILVPPSQTIACAKLIESMGYARIGGDAAPIEEAIGRLARLHKDIQFERGNGRFIVELHWRLFDNPFALPAFDPFLGARSVAITPAHAVKALNASRELVYLCRHGAEHAWSRLKWLADVNALFSSLGWDVVADAYSTARMMGVKRAFDSALVLCHRLLETAVPEHLLAQVDRGWAGRTVVNAAIRAMSYGGAAEIEQMQFETTRKNISHYLLRDDLAYWWRELRFDLTDMPGANQAHEVDPIHRLSTWIQRHRRPLPSGPL